MASVATQMGMRRSWPYGRPKRGWAVIFQKETAVTVGVNELAFGLSTERDTAKDERSGVVSEGLFTSLTLLADESDGL